MKTLIFIITLLFSFKSYAQVEHLFNNVEHVFSTLENKNSRGTVMLLRTLKDTAIEGNNIIMNCQKELYKNNNNYCRTNTCLKTDAMMKSFIHRGYLNKIQYIIQVHLDRMNSFFYNSETDLDDADTSMVFVYDWMESTESLITYLKNNNKPLMCN